MSAIYKCTVCRHEVYSKCVHQRSIFSLDEDPLNHYNMLTGILKYKDVKSEGEGKPPSINLMWLCPSGETTSERLQWIFNGIRALTDREVELYCCVHVYKAKPGEECMFGCCIGEEVEKEVVNVS